MNDRRRSAGSVHASSRTEDGGPPLWKKPHQHPSWRTSSSRLRVGASKPTPTWRRWPLERCSSSPVASGRCSRGGSAIPTATNGGGRCGGRSCSTGALVLSSSFPRLNFATRHTWARQELEQYRAAGPLPARARPHPARWQTLSYFSSIIHPLGLRPPLYLMVKCGDRWGWLGGYAVNSAFNAA